ncbi:hypothetical protein BDR06DRAFT_969484 [Suillus hirtellus]|nr:hypothetical protein BDR06DRAFT_969484 [Suillus hirtellus]
MPLQNKVVCAGNTHKESCLMSIWLSLAPLSQWIPIVHCLEECLLYCIAIFTHNPLFEYFYHTSHFILLQEHSTWMPSQLFLCKNPGGKEVPITTKSIHMMQGINMAFSRCEASILQDRQALSFKYQPNMPTSVDDLTAELFSIMLIDDKMDPDSHSKLWVSHSESQQDREQAHSSPDTMIDAGAGLILDAMQ